MAAVTNNGQLIAGIVQRPTLIPCQYIDESGNGMISDALLCFNWLASRQVQVISCSWGTTVGTTALQQAVMRLSDAGIFISTSAGNNGINTDNSPQYPSAYSATMPSVVGVAALDNNGAIWTRSNYGTRTVQLAAPAVSLIGLGLAGGTKEESGTSMVCFSQSLFFPHSSCPLYAVTHLHGFIGNEGYTFGAQRQDPFPEPKHGIRVD